MSVSRGKVGVSVINWMRKLVFAMLVLLVLPVLPQIVSAVLSNIGRIHYSKAFVEPEMGLEQRVKALHEASSWLRKALSLNANPRDQKRLQALDSLLLQTEQQVGQDNQLRWLSVRDLSLEAGPGLVLRGFDVPAGAFVFDGEFPIRLFWEGANCQVETTHNLIRNGGFEQGVGFLDGSIWPPGYGAVYTRRSSGQYELAVAVPYGSIPTRVMCLRNTDQARRSGLRTRRVPVRSDRLYLIAGWMSQSTDERGQIYAVSYHSERGRMTDTLGRYQFPATRQEENWNLHAQLWRFDNLDENYVQLRLINFHGTGTVCFDNILFVELPAVRPQ